MQLKHEAGADSDAGTGDASASAGGAHAYAVRVADVPLARVVGEEPPPVVVAEPRPAADARAPLQEPLQRAQAPAALLLAGDALALHLILGVFGALHFRTGRWGLGLIYLFTLGGFGWGYLVDFVRLPFIVREYNASGGRMPTTQASMTWDLYALWLTGLLGIPQFWARRTGWGLFHLFTLGGLGVSLLADLERNPRIARAYMARRTSGAAADATAPEPYSVVDAYVLWLPLGVFGAHHFYLGNTARGVLYLLTVGLLGLGFLVDALQMPRLVEVANMRAHDAQAASEGRVFARPARPVAVQNGDLEAPYNVEYVRRG